MKKFIYNIVAIMAIAFAAASTANAQQVTVSDITIEPGKTANVEISITGGAAAAGMQAHIQLPTGLEFVTFLNDDDEVEYFKKGTALKSKHSVTASANELTSTHAIAAVISIPATAMRDEGTVFSFTVKATDTFESGSISFTSIKYNTGVTNENIEAAVTSTTAVAGVAADIADKDVAKYTKNNKLFLKKGKKTFNGNGSIVGKE